MTGDEDLELLARRVVERALAARISIATAESLTAGMVASMLASVPGVSGALRGGVVAYDNSVKERLLGVDAVLLASAGSVDGDVARQMARGARRALDTDIAVATTGVAGPEPHDGKAVGTVFVSVSTSQGEVVEEHSYDGERDGIRRLACRAALQALLGAFPQGPGGTNITTQ